jgi:hypothetical protein
MRSRVAFLTALLLLVAATLEAHDMFLRPDSFFVRPESRALIRALNGTFSSSENAVTRDRLRDISVVGPTGWSHQDTTTWDATSDTTTARLSVQIGRAGTYVVGASTRSREITLDAKDFNTYLADDGIPDVLAARRRRGELGKKATERYSKHIKALLQAGDTRSTGFDTVLGYPAELIPLNNPYLPRSGGWLRVRALVDGKPVADQLVVAGGRTPRGARFIERRVRTDASGVARIRVAERGQWYVKFINMVPFKGDAAIDYESKWATLTFEIR